MLDRRSPATFAGALAYQHADGESVPYVAGWGEDGAIEAVSAFAQTIDSIARQLEEAIADPADHAAEAATTIGATPKLVAG